MDTVTVLMSTYNGEKYLVEQIESIRKQKNIEVHILVRDDGSSDETHSILDRYKNDGVLEWYRGANLGSARSFIDLIYTTEVSEFYAFADQDDIWVDDKLQTAVNQIKSVNNQEKPVLYCGNYQLVDAELNKMPGNGHRSTTTFEASLVSSCCTGCTVVFNKLLVDYLRKERPEWILMHDDWAHKVCLAVGGTVIYDEYKGVMYRQHGNNVDGGIHRFKDRLNKIIERNRNKDCIRSKQVGELVRIYKCDMDCGYVELALKLAEYKKLNFVKRVRLAFNHKLKTPFNRLNRGFVLAVILGYF